MVTPFRPDHAVDLERAQGLASWLVEHGSDAVVVAGSTGESPTLTYREKADLFRAVGEPFFRQRNPALPRKSFCNDTCYHGR